MRHVLSRSPIPVIAGYVSLEELGHVTLIIPDESEAPVVESGEVGFRLPHKLDLLPSLEFGEERSVRDCDFDNGGVRPVSPGAQFLGGSGVFPPDLGGN